MTARAATPEAAPASNEDRPEDVVSSGTGQRVVLHDISWETYESLLADHVDRSALRFAYDQGELEILSPSFVHEQDNRALADIVGVLAEEWDIDIEPAGSTTFKRRDLRKGFEADSCFFFRDPERVRGLTTFDLSSDPPPDLVVEIDVANPSVAKLPIFAKLGVPEVWRLLEGKVHLLRLAEDAYRSVATSGLLPGVTSALLEGFLSERRRLKRSAWLRLVREWARLHVPI